MFGAILQKVDCTILVRGPTVLFFIEDENKRFKFSSISKKSTTQLVLFL